MRFYVHQPMRFELMEEIVFQSINSSLVSLYFLPTNSKFQVNNNYNMFFKYQLQREESILKYLGFTIGTINKKDCPNFLLKSLVQSLELMTKELIRISYQPVDPNQNRKRVYKGEIPTLEMFFKIVNYIFPNTHSFLKK